MRDTKDIKCTHKVIEITKEIEDQVKSMQQIAKNFPENLIGLHVYVFWQHDGVWYRGKIIKHLPASRKYKIIYDDNRDEKSDLTRDYFLVDEESGYRDTNDTVHATAGS